MTRFALLAALLVATIPGPAGADCPTNGATVYSSYGYYEYQHTGPTWSGGFVNYDLTVGTFDLSGGGGGGEQSAGSSLGVSDIYQIIGPASAIPLSFQVVVHLAGHLSASRYSYPDIGSICNSVSAQYTLTSGPTNASYSRDSYSPACTSVDFEQDVSIALQKLPGEAFTVSNGLGVSGSASGNMNGTIQFVGLPSGYSMTSCQGYSAVPTPVSNASWGSLKASYR